jgi:uncharacterized membrane protein
MNKVVVVVFGDEKQAYEGSRALRALDNEASITLYADAVIAKDASGKVAVRRAPDDVPVGTFSGMAIGSLIGLLGGPVGFAIGAGSGSLMGAAFDLTRVGIGEDFITEVEEYLLPGKAAVVAEVDEEWQAPLDTRMEALGGSIFRRNRVEVEDAFFEKQFRAYEAELDALDAELAKASAEHKAKVQKRIQETRRKIQARNDELKQRIDAVKREGDAKVESLKQQIATAGAEQKMRLEKKLAKVRAEYQSRMAKLTEALELTKSALMP